MNSDPRLAAVILAAGQGKRMGGMAKVLCRAGGRTLVESVVAAARGAGVSRIICVLGHQRDQVAAVLPSGVENVEQRERLGTGHAAMQAEPLLKDFPGEALVLCGDTPLLRAETLRGLIRPVRQDRASAAVLTFQAPPGSAYGRIIRDPDGRVLRIVEAKDASPEELAVAEVNGGSYCFRAGELFARLHRLTNRNAQGEYYLTDVVGLLIADGLAVAACPASDPDESLGVNSPEELAAVEAAFRRRAAAVQEV
jgi:bifunctional UDP-N-acetylglucosamine pyrophosphorylase/glucosamine-1-phosphate N-acetyltransferase